MVDNSLFIATSSQVARYDVAAEITFTPNGGSFDRPVRVSVATSDPNITIYYSLNGANPSFKRRTLRSGDSFMVTRSSQLQAIAVYSDGAASPVYRYEFTIRDDDHDGLPDWWESDNFGELSLQSASSNRDGDQFSDLEEFLIGTDPASSNTYTINDITINEDGSTSLVWPAIENRFYRVLGSPDLKKWQYLSDEMSGVEGSMETRLPPSPTTPKRFFRIEVDF